MGYKYEAVLDMTGDFWRVECCTEDCESREVVTFRGPNAAQSAKEYADWMNRGGK